MRTQEIEFDRESLANPYPLYARMRAHDGLVRHRVDGYYFVSRYRDVRDAAMRNEDFSSAIMSAMARSTPLLARLPASFFSAMNVLAVADNPDHEIHRRLMKRHFTKSPVAEVTQRAMPSIDRKIDRFVSQGGGDFAADIASTVPVETTLELLGFPNSDAGRLKRMVDGCVELLAGQFPRQRALSTFAAAIQLFMYTRARMRQLKEHPQEATPVCKAMLDAVDGRVLAQPLIPALASQLIAAGVDSTASLLGNALRMLAESPELARRIRNEPSLIPSFIEECLRLESPFQGHFRVVRRRTVLAGQQLEPGDRLMLLWGAANRDPEAFEKPDELILNRVRTAGTHVSFGYGYHLCLGAELARSTAKYVVGRFVDRTSSVSLTESRPVLRPSPYLRTLTSLPLRVVTA
jgi:cytochrome P450